MSLGRNTVGTAVLADVRLPSRDRRLAVLVAVLAVFFEVSPLFWNRPFYLDWTNHVWLVSYYSNYFAHHWTFPTTIDLDQAFGNPMPSFYGVLFYPPLALLGLALGSSDLAMRLFCGLLLIAPLFVYEKLFRELLGNRRLSLFLAVSVSASVYQLTNLYTRSAMTEFAAHQFIVLALGFISYGLLKQTLSGRAALCAGFACATVGLGTHPITFYVFALFSAPLIAVIGILGWRSVRSRTFWDFGIWSVCSAIILGPWIANTLIHRHDLVITTSSRAANKLYYFPWSIDSWMNKIGLGTDIRVIANGIADVSTPFLDAPLPWGALLALIAVFACFGKPRRREMLYYLIPVAIIFAVLAYALRVPNSGVFPAPGPEAVYATAASSLLVKLLIPIQFVYRLTNTWMLIATLSLLAILGALLRSRNIEAVCSCHNLILIAAIISLLGFGQKWAVTYQEFIAYRTLLARMNDNVSQGTRLTHDVVAIPGRGYREIVRDPDHFPKSFNARDYALPYNRDPSDGAVARDSEVVPARVEDWNVPITVTCKSACVIETNALATIFTDVILDGKLAKDSAFSASGADVKIIAPAGVHTIEVRKVSRLMPLIVVSIWLSIFWIAGSLLFLGFVGIRKYRIADQKSAVEPSEMASG